MDEIKVQFPQPCDQDWQGMAPAGCNRHCTACDTVVYDLEQMTGEQARALMASGQEVCVRAKIGADGAVQLADSKAAGSTRLKTAAVGAAAGLALAACSSSIGGVSPRFTLSGKTDEYQTNYVKLELKGPTKTYRTRPKRDGTYQFTNLKPGSYRLYVVDWCADRHEVGEFEIQENDAVSGPLEFTDNCPIIVGRMTPEDDINPITPADPPARG